MFWKKIFSPAWRFFFKDNLILFSFVMSLALNIASWLLLWWQIPSQKINLFLHYTVYFGVDWVGEWYRIFTLPLFGFLILLLNFILGGIFYKRQKIISYLLILVALLVQILILTQSAMLVMMNS